MNSSFTRTGSVERLICICQRDALSALLCRLSFIGEGEHREARSENTLKAIMWSSRAVKNARTSSNHHRRVLFVAAYEARRSRSFPFTKKKKIKFVIKSLSLPPFIYILPRNIVCGFGFYYDSPSFWDRAVSAKYEIIALSLCALSRRNSWINIRCSCDGYNYNGAIVFVNLFETSCNEDFSLKRQPEWQTETYANMRMSFAIKTFH